MEERLLNLYLDWLNKRNNLSKKNKMPIWSVLSIIITALCFIAASVLYFVNLKLLYIPFVVLIILTALTDYLSEKNQIHQSTASFDHYKEYSVDLFEMISSYNISTKDRISELIDRLAGKRKEIQSSINKKIETTNKWTQALIIPITLAVISGVFSLKSNLTDAFVMVIGILLFVIIIYIVVREFISIMNFSKEVKIDNYSVFIEDLQAIVDLNFGIMSSGLNDCEANSEMRC